MANLTLREVGQTAVNRPLSNTEIDTNLINLNADIATRIPASEKGAVNGVATLGSDGKVPSSQLPSLDYVLNSAKGAVNGVATLGSDGKVPAIQLPSYVDDVVEAANLAAFPATGETGKIYVALDTNKTYRWSGSVYIYITSGAVDSVAGKTGVVTLVKADVGLGSVDNTADSAKNVLSATRLTTSRTIGGVSFDGSANINLPGVNATGNQNTTGTAANVTGTVAIANGGTGATTRQAAMDVLAGAVTSGQYLRGNGTDVVMSAIQAADVPTLNQNTTGTAANVTGIVAVVNGGTGANNAPSARVNLGATTLGGNLFTLGNVTAISFPRINADNTVSSLDAAAFRAAIGAGTSSTTGTVTSVSGTGTVSGLTLTGTVTGSGNLTLGGAITGFLPTTGGTLTGPLVISTGATNNNYNEGIRLTRASNNWAGITFGSTGSSGAPTGGWFAATNPDAQFIVSPDDSSNTSGLTLNKSGNALWRNNVILHSTNFSSYALPLSGGTLSGTLRFGDSTNGLYLSSGRLTVRSESNDNVANFASYGMYLPVLSQTAGLYVESPIEARTGLRMGSGASNGTITVGADTGVVGNRIVQRDGNGYIYANHINFNTTESENATVNSFITSNGDGWSRKASLAHVKNSIRGIADGTWSINVTGNAGTANHLPTSYIGGQQLNPQTYFNSGIGLKVAMTAAAGVWSDTLWINGYSGGDVLQMCALHFQRNGTPRMYISNQASNSSSYGTLHEVLTGFNFSSYAIPLSGGTISGNGTLDFGPNSSWGATLRVGGNGHTGAGRASVVTTNGNLHLDGSTNNGVYMSWYNSGSTGTYFGNGASGQVGRIDGGGNASFSGNVTAYSDENLKKDWSALGPDFVTRLALVKSGTYTRIDSGKRQAGSSAQDWQKLLPEVVQSDADEHGTLSLAYGNAALVSAVELAKRVIEQDVRIERLEALLNTLLNKE